MIIVNCRPVDRRPLVFNLWLLSTVDRRPFTCRIARYNFVLLRMWYIFTCFYMILYDLCSAYESYSVHENITGTTYPYTTVEPLKSYIKKIGNFLYFSIFLNVHPKFLIILEILTTKMAQKHAQKVQKIAEARVSGVGYYIVPPKFWRNGLCVRKAKMPEKKISENLFDGAASFRIIPCYATIRQN